MLEQFAAAKQICKGRVNGFKKYRLKRPCYLAGRQGERLSTEAAHSLLDELEAVEGLRIIQLDTCRSLADKELLDCISLELG